MPHLNWVLPLFVLLIASFIVEGFLKPKPQTVWQREWQAVALTLLILVGLFSFYVAITQRVWLAAMLTLGLPSLLTIVSREKFKHLREPLIFTDWRYFIEVIRYPSLYIPYFGVARALSFLFGFIALLVTWLFLEPVQDDTAATLFTGLLICALTWLTSTQILLRWLVARRYLEPIQDQKDWAGLAMHRVYFWQLNQSHSTQAHSTPFISLRPPAGELPDIICIQAESFVDWRRWRLTDIDTGFASTSYLNWNTLRAECVASGPLHVPAWGANTIRTEFAVLTGLTQLDLGVHRFDPYRTWFKSRPVQKFITLPIELLPFGYNATFMHPYKAAFYDRHVAIPKLGFRRFIDETAFMKSDYANTYIGDAAVGQKILEQLDSTKPSFIYAVTMQGHGPYAPAHTNAIELLERYNHCMQSTDQMLGVLRDALKGRKRPSVLCVFGDHIPILPPVYEKWDHIDGRTDYLVWQNGCKPNMDVSPSHSEKRADELRSIILRASGFTS